MSYSGNGSFYLGDHHDAPFAIAIRMTFRVNRHLHTIEVLLMLGQVPRSTFSASPSHFMQFSLMAAAMFKMSLSSFQCS